jgi:acetoin:2,6-dichlorophenolindophenol oxidoreductase subunit alpha
MVTATTSPVLGTELLLEAFRRMVRVRRFDERAIELGKKGVITGALHCTIGQEAAVVGACIALRDDDWMTGNHRSHGHPIGKGARVAPLMAELLGKATGVCKGKGGSMHLADFSVGSLGESGIVGSGVPTAVGAALSAQIRGTDQVALTFFGDGAAQQGALYESMNLAGLWRLPVIFFCENNGYASTTSFARMSAVPDLAVRAEGFAMPGVVVDGQDVEAVHGATAAAVERARRGEGPTMIEAKTYRYQDHAEGLLFATNYRTASEVERWRQRDPIDIGAAALLAAGVDGERIAAVRSEVDREIDDAVEFAIASPLPDPSAAFDDLYAEPITIRGRS